MTIKIIGSMALVDTVQTMLTAYEMGVSDLVEFEDVSLQWTKQPQCLAMNPFGKMPIMVDGEFTLHGSRAIMRYLVAKFEDQGTSGQGTSLRGFTLKERARVDQWIEVESQMLGDPCKKIVYERLTKPVYKGVPVHEDAREELGTLLDVYDAHLAKSIFLAGGFFSLADISHLPVLDLLVNSYDMRDLVYDRPNVKRWWEEITARRPWRKACGKEPAAAKFETPLKEVKRSELVDE